MGVKLLTEYHLDFLSLKGGCTGSYESIHVKIPHCWKSHVAAHIWFYGDRIWIRWKRKQNWILYMYGFMETGYGYGGKESRIGSCICMILWRRDMDTVGKKAELDPVHLLYFRDRIWIKWNRLHVYFRGKNKWILYIKGIN